VEQTSPISPEEAGNTLDSVHVTRAATRERLGPYWFALVVFGVLTMLSSPLFDVRDGAGVALFWLVAGPAGMFVVARHERAHVLATGAARAERPYAVTIGALAVAWFAVGAVGGATGNGDIATLGAPLAVAGAYLVFAWLGRSLVFAAWAMVLAAVTIIAVVADLDGISRSLAIGIGGNLLFLGLSERRSQPA
jgi:energy-converting hydrogenase Eha subunit E